MKQLLDFSKIKYKYQPKDVWKEKNFEIVAVADFLFKDKILECKSPTRMRDEIPKWYKPQLEAQFRIFKKPIYLILLKERFETKFFKYKPDDKLWEKIIEKVGVFHKELKVIQ